MPLPLSQRDVETPLRDIFKHGDITNAALWRKVDRSELNREILADYPDKSSLWRWYVDLDSFYRARFELGQAYFALTASLNARYQREDSAIEAVDLLREICGVVQTLSDRNAPEAVRMEAAQRGQELFKRFEAGLGLRAEEDRPAILSAVR